VLDVLVGERDSPVHQVVPLRGPLRNAESHDMRYPRGHTALDLGRVEPVAPPIVLEALPSRLGRLALRLELGRGAEASVLRAPFQQGLDVAPVALDPLRLVVDLLVPHEPEP